VVDVAAVEQSDISFVQLILGASRTATRHGRIFRLSGASPALVQTFARAGIGLDPAAGQISHP
jgi:anti-anti-sigma regulatory factor